MRVDSPAVSSDNHSGRLVFDHDSGKDIGGGTCAQSAQTVTDPHGPGRLEIGQVRPPGANDPARTPHHSEPHRSAATGALGLIAPARATVRRENCLCGWG